MIPCGLSLVRRFLILLIHHPSIITFIASIVVYWDDTALHGTFVYDDAGSIKNNVVVIGKVPIHELFYRDYWGTKLDQIQSHKSFRPITTLTFKLNYDYATMSHSNDSNNSNEKNSSHSNNIDTYWFHVVNVLLHAFVTAMVTEISFFVFKQRPSSMSTTTATTAATTECNNNNNKSNRTKTNPSTASTNWSYYYDHCLHVTIPQLISGTIFGIHPVHAEAVSNITSRCELLMSLFTLLGFLSYHTTLQRYSSSSCNFDEIERSKRFVHINWYYICGIYIIPLVCMILSLFSKEQGITTLLTILAYDFIMNQYSIKVFLQKIRQEWNEGYNKMFKQQQQKQQQQQEQPNQVEPQMIPNDHDDQQQKVHSFQTLSIPFLYRSSILLIQTIVVALYRKWLNGSTVPDFVYNQNPAGFASKYYTRLFSIPYVYCLYIYDILIPNRLCPDWSGTSIQLIESFWNEPRVLYVLLLWTITVLFLYELGFGVPTKHRKQQQQQRNNRTTTRTSTNSSNDNSTNESHCDNDDVYVWLDSIRNGILVSFFSFTFSPFLLSSNLLVVVGLMKADRVIYLPLLGFCILEGLFVQTVLMHCRSRYGTASPTRTRSNGSVETITNVPTAATTTTATATQHYPPKQKPNCNHNDSNSRKVRSSIRFILQFLLYGCFLGQVQYFCKRVHERNLAWSHSLNLWVSAYTINPSSAHTVYNCGYELSLQRRYSEAEQVLRPIANPHIEGPSNTFVYAMVLFNLRRCIEAMNYIDMGLNVIEQKLQNVDETRNTVTSLKRTKSNLLVAKAFCTTDVRQSGQILYNAVQVDPMNQYAIDQATEMVKRIELLNQMEHQQQQQQQQQQQLLFNQKLV